MADDNGPRQEGVGSCHPALITFVTLTRMSRRLNPLSKMGVDQASTDFYHGCRNNVRQRAAHIHSGARPIFRAVARDIGGDELPPIGSTRVGLHRGDALAEISVAKDGSNILRWATA